jgi:hypothetical protein
MVKETAAVGAVAGAVVLGGTEFPEQAENRTIANRESIKNRFLKQTIRLALVSFRRQGES